MIRPVTPVTLGLLVGLVTFGASATEKTAKLTDPATTGAAVQTVPGDLVEVRAPVAAPAAVSSRLGLSGLERDRIRAAVRGQVRALAAHDADGAFAYLTPLIQDHFASAGRFLQSVNRDLAPVFRSREFALTGLEREASDAIQHVVFTGPAGGEWLARFKLVRQPDGRWRIKSCHVEAAEGRRT